MQRTATLNERKAKALRLLAMPKRKGANLERIARQCKLSVATVAQLSCGADDIDRAVERCPGCGAKVTMPCILCGLAWRGEIARIFSHKDYAQ
jgi:hypothetical protein